MTMPPARRTVVLGVSGRVRYPAISVTNEFASTIARAEDTEVVNVDARGVGTEPRERIVRNVVRFAGRGALANRLRHLELPAGRADLLVVPTMPFRDLWVLAGLDLSTIAERSICFIDEIWAPDVQHFGVFRDVLTQFDAVYLSVQSPVRALADEIGTDRVRWIPPATDALERCPASDQQRGITVLSVGRRSDVQHAELLAAARRRRLTYLFDTLRGAALVDSAEHRTNAAQLIRNSRFYIAHRAKFDAPEETGEAADFGGRFFDAQAAGSIPIGDPPRTREFRTLFSRPGSMVIAPAGEAGIVDQVLDLLAEPDQLEAASRANVVDALRSNDWIHRWSDLLASVGMQLQGRGEQRRRGLAELADLVEQRRPHDTAHTEVTDAWEGTT